MDAFGWSTVSKIASSRFSDIYKVCKKEKDDTDTVENDKQTLFYALKVVDPDDEKPPHNIRNELKILNDLKDISEKNGLKNENVVELICCIYDKMEFGLLFPIYDLTLKGLLKQFIKSRTMFNPDGTIEIKKRNTISLESISDIIIGICNGLEWIHSQGIIHRDINPNNIMFIEDDLKCPVIIDFGISYQLPNNNGIEKPDMKFTDIATGIYKAPELLLSKRDYSNKVDMWALGIIISLLLSNDGNAIFEEDAGFSDLVLLSNILSIFGSPPEDWSDCIGLVSFDSMNRAFFTKPAKPLAEVIPKIYSEEESDYNSKLEEVFKGLTQYENMSRLSATDCLKILC